MKKYLLAIPIIILPYFVVFELWAINNEFIMSVFYFNNGYLLIVYLVFLCIIALASALFISISSLTKKENSKDLALFSMIIKILHIPAYIAIFFLGTIYLISIWLLFVVFCLILIDFYIIILTGINGVAASVRCYKEQKLKDFPAIILGICQFIFVIDIIASIILFIETKKRINYQEPNINYNFSH